MNLQKTINLVRNRKKEIIIFLVIFLCLFLAMSFPSSGIIQLLSRILFFLVILPALFIKMILKKDLAEFGLNFSGKKRGFFWAFLMLALSFIAITILFYFFDLGSRYTLPSLVIHNFWAFVFYETIAMNFIIFVFEFFFRGFLQSTLEKMVGFWSPLVQFIVFIGFLFFIRKLDWQYAPLIILSATGGIVTYKSKSFIYPYLMGLIFTLAIDLYAITLLK